MTDVGAAWTPHVCRLCLAQTTVCFSLIEDTEASGMLEALTSLRILPTDEISTVMCLKCRLNLKLAFSIQQNMLKAERRFREQQLSTPTIIKQECDNDREPAPEFEHVEIDETVQLPEDRNRFVRQLLREAASRTHRCDICGAVKSCKRNLQLHHYNVHKGKTCPHCNRDIKMGRFKAHLEKHESEKLGATGEGVACEICGIRKATRRLLENHRYNVHATKRCPQCGEDVKVSKFGAHVDVHNGTVSFTCDVCGVEKSSRRNLSHHKYNVHMSRKCPKCNRDIKLTKFKHHVDSHNNVAEDVGKDESDDVEGELRAVDEELRVVENESRVVENESDSIENLTPGKDSFPCHICGSVKSSKRKLQYHIYNAHKFRKCVVCNKIVKTNYYRMHMAKHSAKADDPNVKVRVAAKTTANKTFPCDLCSVVKESQAKLTCHKYSTHLEAKCPICDKQIKQINIRRHIERHKNIQTVCEICGTTMNSHDLNSHMHYAHKQRSFQCQSCDKVFKKKQSLLAHEKREHLKKADFVCETCGKCFHARIHLKKHVDSTHLKLRPFICEFCKVGFSSRFALRTHIRQHTNETPYKCQFCSEGFRQNVSLRAHLKSKHNVKEELICECPTCGKKFASSAALIAHSRIH